MLCLAKKMSDKANRNKSFLEKLRKRLRKRALYKMIFLHARARDFVLSSDNYTCRDTNILYRAMTDYKGFENSFVSLAKEFSNELVLDGFNVNCSSNGIIYIGWNYLT